MNKNQPNNFKLTWLPKKTFEIVATIPWTEIEQAKGKAILEAGKAMEIKGFRKGKAPEKVVLENIPQGKLLQYTLEGVIPEYYQKAISSFGLKPILSPKIELLSSKEKEDWQVKFISCEEPDINLGNYKEEIKKIKAADMIWTPEKGGNPTSAKPNQDPKDEEKEREKKLEKVIKFLQENVKVEICDLLIETEVNRKLAELLDQIQKLGLTLDQYLSSTGKTIDLIREEYKTQVERSLCLQFLLSAISEAEKIEVEPQEIEKAISSAKNEEERKTLESQKYFLATVLRQQKTLDFLANL